MSHSDSLPIRSEVRENNVHIVLFTRDRSLGAAVPDVLWTLSAPPAGLGSTALKRGLKVASPSLYQLTGNVTVAKVDPEFDLEKISISPDAPPSRPPLRLNRMDLLLEFEQLKDYRFDLHTAGTF
ncbi:Large tegument protein deneddylase [Clarias magur]|uniref:Large tegument protein deneddylase n=1 Tax=Clarias magur TaxID=1594786 RepID=A0A8J4X096_CLAMG|nr:Large tegument protein deneddylase [Clarias magur]